MVCCLKHLISKAIYKLGLGVRALRRGRELNGVSQHLALHEMRDLLQTDPYKETVRVTVAVSESV